MASDSESTKPSPNKTAKRQVQKSASGRARKATKKVTFTYDNPQAGSVALTGSFCSWKTDAYPLTRDVNGVWKVALSLPAGRHEYRFIVDGEWKNDPRCSEVVTNQFGSENCIFTVE